MLITVLYILQDLQARALGEAKKTGRHVYFLNSYCTTNNGYNV